MAVTVFALLIGAHAGLAEAQSLSNGKGHLRVMTYNVNEGTDFLEVVAARNLSEFLVAVGQTIAQVRATNPPERMQAVARQIISAAPALVSLQELDQWFTGPFDPTSQTCGAVTLEFDMIQELLDALAAQGGHYEVAVQAQQFAFPPTPGWILPATFLCVQVVNYNALLARTDLGSSTFQWSNPQSTPFTDGVVLPNPVGPVPLPRVWASVDAAFHGSAFRFIGTHLEPADPGVRELQGHELRTGPANTPLPVIIAMDSNAKAAPLPADPTYLDFIDAGYKDAWSTIFPRVAGFTCCQAQLVNNPVSELSERIDLILALGKINVESVALFAADPVSRMADGLWPSDHVGVAAALEVEGD